MAGSAAFGQRWRRAASSADCAVQKIASYAIGSMIRKYNTCEVNDIRAQINGGTITSLFSQVALANFLRARTGGAK